MEYDYDNEKMIKSIKTKLEFYKEQGNSVHVLFNNISRTTFYNGEILSICEDKFIINDKKFGHSMVLLQDIKVLERYTESKNA